VHYMWFLQWQENLLDGLDISNAPYDFCQLGDA